MGLSSVTLTELLNVMGLNLMVGFILHGVGFLILSLARPHSCSISDPDSLKKYQHRICYWVLFCHSTATISILYGGLRAVLSEGAPGPMPIIVLGIYFGLLYGVLKPLHKKQLRRADLEKMNRVIPMF